MKKILFILLFTIPFMGFSQSYERMKSSDLRSTNRMNLNKVSLDMTKSEVLNIMGTETYRCDVRFKNRFRDLVNNPYKTEVLNEEGKTYEVIFYFTDVKEYDGVINDDELTPIVFYKGKVVGYGWLYVKDNIKRYSIDMK